jgi:hypothetical protein
MFVIPKESIRQTHFDISKNYSAYRPLVPRSDKLKFEISFKMEKLNRNTERTRVETLTVSMSAASVGMLRNNR